MDRWTTAGKQKAAVDRPLRAREHQVQSDTPSAFGTRRLGSRLARSAGLFQMRGPRNRYGRDRDETAPPRMTPVSSGDRGFESLSLQRKVGSSCSHKSVGRPFLGPSVSSVVPVFTFARTNGSIEAAELSGMAARRMRHHDPANRPERRSVGSGSLESRRRRPARWGFGGALGIALGCRCRDQLERLRPANAVL